MDTVAVRSIMLPNGQPASVIMERGRIQRIVAANGQVAELKWHQSPAHLQQAYGPVRDGQPKVSISNPSNRCSLRLWYRQLADARRTCCRLQAVLDLECRRVDICTCDSAAFNACCLLDTSRPLSQLAAVHLSVLAPGS